MNWKKVTLPLSLALAAGVFFGATATAQDAERPADRTDRPRAARRAPPVERSPQEQPLRIRRVRPLDGRGQDSGPGAVRPRRGPQAKPGPRPEMQPWRRGEAGAPNPRLRSLLMRLREALIRNPDLAPRLERWLEAQMKAAAKGGPKGKPKRRGKPVKGKKVPPQGKGKAQGKRVPPPGKEKHKKKIENEPGKPAIEKPARPTRSGGGAS